MKPTLTPSAPVSESELRGLLNEYRKTNWHRIQTPEWQAKIVEDIIRDDGWSVFKELAGTWHLPDGATVLDIGSGVGTFVLACRRRGLTAFGIEPDRIGQGVSLTSIQIAKRRTENQVFAVALGERLPFPDRSFDLINLNQVIEHVSNQTEVLAEAGRVLKPGGAIFLACPNYLRFYEPHYKIFWLPLLPKFLGRLYLRFRGRDPVLLDQIKYTTNSRLRQLTQKLGPNFVIRDLHGDGFRRKCEQGTFVSARGRAVQRMMLWPVLGRWISAAAQQFLRWTEGGCEMIAIRRDQ